LFEDLGFFCVDNLPPTFILKFAELCLQSEGKISKIALVCDMRGGAFSIISLKRSTSWKKMRSTMNLFLEASDEVLLRRYKETRRRHPLSDMGCLKQFRPRDWL